MPLEVDVRSQDGGITKTVELDPAWFAVQPNVPVMHQVVTAQLAAARAGTQSTKTRAEVAGGGKKPFRQKGTGRARQGSTRAPHWSGGGVALGPKPRSYAQRTPKKMIALALRSALSDRASLGQVAVIDRWDFETPKTKDAIAALEALELQDTKVLLVMSYEDEAAYKSFRNLEAVQLIFTTELNAYDILVNDAIVFTEATLPGTATEVAGSSAKPAKKAAAKKAPATKPPAAKAAAKLAVAEEADEAEEEATVEDGVVGEDGVGDTEPDALEESGESGESKESGESGEDEA
jgi:large subunit ribosomal protein L4